MATCDTKEEGQVRTDAELQQHTTDEQDHSSSGSKIQTTGK